MTECKHIPLDPKPLPESVAGCEDCMAGGRIGCIFASVKSVTTSHVETAPPTSTPPPTSMRRVIH